MSGSSISARPATSWRRRKADGIRLRQGLRRLARASSPTPRSTSCRSPRRTGSISRWRLPRSRPASMSGARSRWRRGSPIPRRCWPPPGPRARSRSSATTTSRTRSSGTSGKLLDEGRDRHGQPCPHRDGRGFPGRPRGAVPAAPRGVQRLWRARRFRRASAVAGPARCSAASPASCATWRSPIRRASTPEGEREVEVFDIATILLEPRKRRFGLSSRSAAPPGAARAASPSRFSARRARSSTTRSG